MRRRRLVQLVLIAIASAGCVAGLNPELYLRHVLTRIGDHPINRIAELLLWNIAHIRAKAIPTDA